MNIKHYNYINVGDWIQSKQLYDEVDEALNCTILNEDKVVDELEDIMALGGNIVDFHTCDFFPERWFSLVLVFVVEDTKVYYDRLKQRGYSSNKINQNVECEIMQVVLQEAMESYEENIVIKLNSVTIQDLESNLERTQQWLLQNE